jgi:sugar phosphate isomerase/epimerase
VGQLQLLDNKGAGDCHIGMGRGSIDFGPVFEWIGSMKTRPIITLEPHKKEDFAASLEFLEQNNFLDILNGFEI